MMQLDADTDVTAKFFVPEHIPAELVQPFNLFSDPEMSKCPFAATHKLRQHGRVFWNPTNPLFRGSWVLTRAEDLRHVMSNPHLFSNKGEAGFMTIEGENLDLIPLEVDPPRHTKFRKLLNPVISPPVVAAMTEGVAKRAVDLIEVFRAKGECEFVESFGIPFPVSIFMQLMGLPEEDMKMLLGWENALVHTGETASANASMEAAAIEVGKYLDNLAAKRKADPTDDITSYVVTAKIDGEPLTEREIKGIMYLLFLAGLDTVTATMSWFFHHLAVHPEQQQQLRENLDMIPKAIEELLRRYSIVVSHRQCTRDVEVAGVEMKKGDWISILDTLGSTDPSEFEDPLAVDFERRNVRHFGFSFGPHFCMGAHLARRELEVALREWLTRIPMWRLKPGVEMKTHGGHTFGYDNLDLVWDI